MKHPAMCAAVALIAFGAATGARAGSIRDQQSTAVWKKQDQCARTAFTKFPDYTPQGNADRDQAMRACEIANGIPIRAPIAESPVKTLPDSAAD